MSGKFFAAHLCSESWAEANRDSTEEDRRYFYDCLMAPMARQVETVVDRLDELPIRTIAPGHGPAISESWRSLLADYRRWGEGQERANSNRRERGWEEMRLRGWVQQPHYDEKTNNLKWAFNLSSSSDNYESVWINQSIRLLGRTGVMNVTLVGNPEKFAIEEASVDALLANNFSYLPGARYAEFKEGDKIAEYGLAALVLGGAGAFAAKSGLLAKFWKFIVIGAVALAGFFKNIWNRITGSRPTGTSAEEEK